MKSSLFYSIVLASIAAVCAAPVGSTDLMSSTNGPQSIQVVAIDQGSTVKPNSLSKHEDTVTSQNYVDSKNTVTTSSTPVVKPATQQDIPDEGYTIFLITAPNKYDIFVKGTT